MEEHEREQQPEIAAIDLFIRVKPLTTAERDDKKYKESVLVSRNHREIYVQMAEKTYRKFSFDFIFNESTKNREIFTRCCQPQVDRFLSGYNSTVFVYGQSGTGKTFTMGLLDQIDTYSDGLVPLSIKLMFERLVSMPGCSISISMVQVYKEEAYDLLNSKKGPALIREDPASKIFFLPGLVIVPVEDDKQAVDLLNAGLQLRTMAPQSLNPTSSRSHLIVTFYLKKRMAADSEAVISKLTFADLAGNERVGKSESKGIRLEEARAINSSLSCLSEAICQLKSTNETFLFRKSKLTKILQASLMGQSYICILGMVRKSPNFVSETIATLNFVVKCRNIKMTDPSQCVLADFREDLQNSAEPKEPRRQPEEPEAEEDVRCSQGEFNEFSAFLGKCLISLSRMIRKVHTELAVRSQNTNSSFPGEESSYIALQTQTYSEDLVVVPEEMLLDLSEAEGIPDVLITFQSAFKMLIEQLKKLSEKASQSSIEFTEITAKMKSEFQEKFARQATSSASQLAKLLRKALNQMLITKFESLSTGTTKDQKQLASVLQHYAQYSLSLLLNEFQDAMRPLLGDSAAGEVSSSLRRHLQEHSSSMTGGALSLSTISLGKQYRDCGSQTVFEEVTRPAVAVQTISRGVQVSYGGSSVKSQFVQVDDTITAKKMELLMAANKKLGEQLKSMKDLADDRENRAVVASLERKLAEANEGLTREKVENERLRAALEQASREGRNMVEKLREVETYAGESLNKELERAKQEASRIIQELQESERRAMVQLEGLRRILEAKAGELEIERKANGQLQERLSQEIQAAVDIKAQLQAAVQQNTSIAFVLETQKAEAAGLREEIQRSREEAQEQTAMLLREQEALQKRLSNELSEAENQRQKALERMTSKVAELNAEMSKQAEVYNQKISHMAASIEQMEAELDSKDKMVRELQAANNVLADEKWVINEELENVKSEIINEKRLMEEDLGKKSKLEDEYRRLKEKLTESGYRMRDIEKENNTLKEARANLIFKIEQIQENLTEAEQREKDVCDQYADKLKVIEKMEAYHASAMEELEESNRVLSTEISSLRGDLDETKMKLKEKEELMTRQVSNYEKRIESLSRNLEDDSSLKHQLTTLQEELSQKDLRIIQLEHNLDQSKRQSGDLGQQLEAYNNKVAKIEDAFKKLVEENGHLSSSLKTTGEKLGQQHQMVESLQQEKSKLEERLEMYKVEAERLKGEIKEGQSWDDKLTAYLEEIESLRGQLSQKDSHNQELTSQLHIANSKVNERSALLKKANEESQALEKEVIELRPMKKELVNLSITMSKIKEDAQTKDKTISKLNNDIEQLKGQVIEKAKETESVAAKFKKAMEDFKRLQEQTNLHHVDEKAKIIESYSQEIEKIKAASSETVAQIKREADAAVQAKDAKIQQLLSDVESKTINTENEKNELIFNLQNKIAALQETERQSHVRYSEEMNSLLNKHKEELLAVKQKSLSDTEMVQKERNQLSSKLSEVSEQARMRGEELAKAKATVEEVKRAIHESEERQQGFKEKLVQSEKVITDLLEANKVLTNTLKSIKRQHNSVPKVQSNHKENQNGQVYPPVPQPHKIMMSSSTERRVENNLITNFEKHLTNTTATAAHQNPIAQYINNKENKDFSNQAYILPAATGFGARKYTPEEYDRVLAERKVAQESNIAASNLLKPPVLGTNASSKTQAHLSPSKPQGLLASSIGGLHILSDETAFGDNTDPRFDDGAKGYSSRYSRNSRTSRNSRRSPTPSKEHASVH